MLDQTRAIISQRRSWLSDEDRAHGWEYVYWIVDNCIWGAFVRSDGTTLQLELLERCDSHA